MNQRKMKPAKLAGELDEQGFARLLANPANRAVLAVLHDKSAHSDVGSIFLAATRPLGDVQVYCPDWSNCRFVVAATQTVVFGGALGMSLVAFRLDEKMKARALATGGESWPEAGPAWVTFQLFRYDWPRVDVEFWARQAYVCARSATPG